jgi:hypothetical protein
LLNHGIQLNIKNEGEIICGSFDVSNKKNEHLLTQRKAGEYTVTVNFPTPLLKAGDYTIDLHVSKFGYGSIQVLENALSFEIDVLTKDPKYQFYAKNRPGYCAFEPSWNYE